MLHTITQGPRLFFRRPRAMEPSRPGFLNLSTSDTGAGWLFVVEAVLCTVKCLATSLAFTRRHKHSPRF